MATLVTAGGRLVQAQLPAQFRAAGGLGGGFFPPLWSDGTTHEDIDGRTVSFTGVYEKQPWVAAVVNKLARQIATLPLKVYRKDATNGRERLIDHPLEALLNRPAPRKSQTDLLQWAALPALIHGNALLGKFREDPDAPPSELIPIDWRYVSAYARQGGPVEWWGTTQTGAQAYIKADNVLHFAWQSPGGEVGVSPLRQLGVTIRNEDASQRYAVSSFANAARPANAIVLPPDKNLTREQREDMRKEIELTHGGVDRAFRTMILGGGADIKPLSHSAQEAELIESRRINREEVAAVFDVSGPLIGDLTHGTYSNVAELHKMLYKTTLRPWLALIESVIASQLIDPEPEWAGLFAEFDLGEVLRGSKQEEIEAAVNAFTNGLMTLNEVRKVLNLPPVEDPSADKPHIPANNLQPMDQQTDPRRQALNE